MGERILVPFDGSPLATRALQRAVTGHPDDEITVLYVIDPVHAVYEAEAKGLPEARAWQEWMDERAAALCAEAAEIAAEHDCAVETAVERGRPAREILAFADRHDVEHIVMGSHGRSGIARLVLGSVAERVLRRSPVTVTIVR